MKECKSRLNWITNSCGRLVCLVVSFVILLSGVAVAHDTKRPPNIVLIMADDLGYECLGCNGSLSYQTPCLDRIAKKGLRFTNCHSQPLCTPTRNQIMTGQYNFRNYENFEYLDPAQKTFAHLLKEAGYATCIAGKWQLNGRGWKREGRTNPQRPQDAGFDKSCLWQVTGLGNRYRDPVLEVNGKTQEFPDRYGPDVCVEFINQFISNNKSKPFLVYYPMILTHSPFVPTPDSDDWASRKKTKNKQQYFADMVQYMDKLVGQIENSLKENGVLDNTVLIFTGDNGTTRGLTSETKSGPVLGAKGMTIDTGTHVPLVVSWPSGGSNPGVCEDLIDFSDFLPTLVDAAGRKIPEDSICDGVSFFPQLNGKPGTPRPFIYCFYDPVHSNNVNQYRNRLARNKRFKVYRDGSVFDVLEDPLEKQPLKRGSLTQREQKQVNFLDAVVKKFDEQGAAKAAEVLAKKVRPPGAKKSSARKKRK